MNVEISFNYRSFPSSWLAVTMTHWLRVEAAIGRHSILLIEKPYRSNIYTIMAKFANPFLNLIGVLTNIILIFVGFNYLMDCPAEILIPVYLMAAGILNLLLPPGANRNEMYRDPSRLFLGLAKAALTLTGYIWIASPVINHQDPLSAGYCYRPLYLTALWLNRINLFFFAYYAIVLILFLTYKPWSIDVITHKRPKRFSSVVTPVAQ